MDKVGGSSRGRPRKHQTGAARVQAFRDAHNLRKATVDIPHEAAGALRLYARVLRELASLKSVNKDAKFEEAQTGKKITSTLLLSIKPGTEPPHWEILARERTYQYGLLDTATRTISIIERSYPQGFYWSVRFAKEISKHLIADGYARSVSVAMLMCEIVVLDQYNMLSPELPSTI